jgi:hypothetical protein
MCREIPIKIPAAVLQNRLTICKCPFVNARTPEKGKKTEKMNLEDPCFLLSNPSSSCEEL